MDIINGTVRPILFNKDMVRAILAGRKTATRRAIRPRYKKNESGFEIARNKGTGRSWVYAVDDEGFMGRDIVAPYRPGDTLYVREPSIHMPKAAARIWLEVTDVRVEHLQDMRLDDFLKEGIVIRPEAFNDPENAYAQAQRAFIDLWGSTIPEKDKDLYGWEADPAVWVIEFERCRKPESEG